MPKPSLQDAPCPLKSAFHFKGAEQASENTCHWETLALEEDTAVQDLEVGDTVPGILTSTGSLTKLWSGLRQL